MNLHFLAAQTPHRDPYALLLLAVLVVAFVIWVLVNKSKKKKAVAEPAPVIAEEAPKSVAPGSAGQLKLHNVEPKTAAMLMAIVADQMGKPLNELRFISIKEVDE